MAQVKICGLREAAHVTAAVEAGARYLGFVFFAKSPRAVLPAQAAFLGRDVPPEIIVEAVQQEDIRLVGLSALMTTTLPAMEESVRRLKALPHPPQIMLGGAVVTQDYADRLGCHYARDAKASVEIARRVFA